jgi:N6-adenosine-specific RNA methylase IME4
MSDREIAALPVADLLHPDGAWIFLWVTSPKFHASSRSGRLLSPDEIVRPWGAQYSGRAFVWVKIKRSMANGLPFGMTADSLHVGMGYGTRKNAEDCFLFRVGSPKRLARDVHEIILAPVREHSRKPDEAIERIERFCAGPRVELFARETRPRWDLWGDEVGKFAAEGVS